MKMQRNEALREIRKLHSAVKEEITLKAREYHKLEAEISSLKQQRINTTDPEKWIDYGAQYVGRVKGKGI